MASSNTFAIALAIFVNVFFAAGSSISSNNEKEPVVGGSVSSSVFQPLFSDAALSTSFNSRCGGVLTAQAGFLEYKRTTELGINERCVWIIRAENATRYMVHLHQIGFESNPNDTQLILSGIGLTNTASQTNHTVLTPENAVVFVADRNILVLTLHTGTSTVRKTGFRLEYSALANPSNPPTLRGASPRSHDYLVAADLPSGIRHPESGYYDNYELTTFVIAPKDNIFQGRGLRSEVLYGLVGLEGHCYDHLDVFKFNVTSQSSTKWEYAGRLCSDVNNTRIYSEDLLLIVFRTDYSVASTGFSLQYEYGCGSSTQENTYLAK